MKLGRKRIPRGNFLLFISFTAISFCFLLIISAINAQNRNRLSSNNMYSGHQKDFTIMYSENEAQWDEVIPKLHEKYNNFALYTKVPDQEKSIRGIYINGEVDNPPMLQGQYFDDETSWTDKPAVVIGKDYRDGVTERNDEMYYTMNGIEYKVLGVMGTKYDSRLNHMIMIDFKSAVSLTGINTSYMLDTKKKDDINEVGQELTMLFSYPADLLILLGEGMPVSFIGRMLSSDMIMNTLYIMILISFSLSTILVTFIWLRFRSRLFFAFSLCGYDSKSECLEISKRFYSISGIGFLTGFIVMSVISAFLQDIYMSAGSVVAAFATTVGLGSILLFLSYFVYVSKSRRK